MELLVERKNIENMIVNSKLWSPLATFSNNDIEKYSIVKNTQKTAAPAVLNVELVSKKGAEDNNEKSTHVKNNSSFYETKSFATTNLFKDKKEELTRILRKRLNYIH